MTTIEVNIMWRRTSLVVTFALVAASAAAQARPAPPAPPVPPAPPIAVAPVPPVPPGVSLDLELLGARLGNLAPVALPDTTELERLVEQQAKVVARGQNLLVYSGETAEYDRGTSYLDSGRYDRAVESFDKVIAKGGAKTEGAMYWKAYALNRLGRRDESLRTIDEQLKKFPSGRWANDAKALIIDVKQASGQPMSPDKTNDEDLKLIALNSVVMRDPDRGIPMVEQILAGSASPRLKEKALFVLAQSGSPRAKTLLAEYAKGKGNPDLQLKALDYLGAFGGGPDVPLLVDVYRSTSDIDVKKRVIRSLAMTGRRGMLLTPGYEAFNFAYADSMANYYLSSEQAKAAMERARVELERTREAYARGDITITPAPPAPPVPPVPPAPPSDQKGQLDQQRVAARSAASAEREKAREAKAKEASDALWTLYQGEQSVELKREILRNMRFAGQTDRLLQIAKTESNPEIRQAALQGLTWNQDQKQTTDLLVGLYRGEKDAAVKRQIVDSLQGAGAAAALVQLARQETDPQLRKRIVERLSTMKDREATDYMMEILKK
jgi:tetratricopeptide (TPR) repeat protein